MELRPLKVEDVSENYVSWFSDEDVTKYSDNQYYEFSLEGQISYVQECLSNKDIMLFGIFADGKHIGNIVLKGQLSVHKRAEITYFIGEKSYWGKGIGRNAVSKIIQIAKLELKLNKLFAGVAKNNKGSRKILELNNFVLEGIRKKHLFYNNNFEDQYDYGLIL